MFIKTRVKTVTEKAFEDRQDNFIIGTHEKITHKFLGITISVKENIEDLKSVTASDKEQKKVAGKKKIGFNVD
jgi:hypothetical protein